MSSVSFLSLQNKEGKKERIVGLFWFLVYETKLHKVEYYDWFYINHVLGKDRDMAMFICHSEANEEFPYDHSYVLYSSSKNIEMRKTEKYTFRNSKGDLFPTKHIIKVDRSSWSNYLALIQKNDREIFPFFGTTYNYVMAASDKLLEANNSIKNKVCTVCNKLFNMTIFNIDLTTCTEHTPPEKIKTSIDIERSSLNPSSASSMFNGVGERSSLRTSSQEPKVLRAPLPASSMLRTSSQEPNVENSIELRSLTTSETKVLRTSSHASEMLRANEEKKTAQVLVEQERIHKSIIEFNALDATKTFSNMSNTYINHIHKIESGKTIIQKFRDMENEIESLKSQNRDIVTLLNKLIQEHPSTNKSDDRNQKRGVYFYEICNSNYYNALCSSFIFAGMDNKIFNLIKSIRSDKTKNSSFNIYSFGVTNDITLTTTKLKSSLEKLQMEISSEELKGLNTHGTEAIFYRSEEIVMIQNDEGLKEALKKINHKFLTFTTTFGNILICKKKDFEILTL